MAFPLRIARTGLLGLALSACSQPSETPVSRPYAPPPPFLQHLSAAELQQISARPLQAGEDWSQRWWLEKTVRLLRGGEGLRAGENAEEWLKLPREQAVERLMADPRFGNAVLDFNLYFLGFKSDGIRVGNRYSEKIFSFPSALASAQEVLRNGDYFRLLDLESPWFAPTIKVFNVAPEEKDLSNLEIFRQRATAYQASLRTVIDFAQKDSAATVTETCLRLQKDAQLFKLQLIGIPFPFLVEVMLGELSWYGNVYRDCVEGASVTLATLSADLESAFNLNARYFRQAEKLADDRNLPANVLQIQAMPFAELGLAARFRMSWSDQQKIALPNSSTNMNRKRAAYVLKRFFCDDLTPIGVEDSGEDHTGGVHGSQPSCKACHYKLDPMAGFFRNHGSFFQDFTGSPEIVFDDNARTDLQRYLNAWRAPAGSGREWNVGYIRSASKEALNDYGSSLADLHALFRRAPEVKACFVKRIFEYALGESQTIDPGFTALLTEQFTERSAANPADAFRWLMAQVALSRSFREPDLEPNLCYDFRPGADPTHSPPCRVAYILEKNCVSCHKSTSGAGSLNLKEWIEGPDGQRTFPHLGSDGKQKSLESTLESIVARLQSADPEKRMPLRKHMSAQDRQALYLWAQGVLSGPKKKMGGFPQ